MEEAEENQRKKSPAAILLSIFLVFIFILSLIPFYGIKLDPKPKRIPDFEEVVIGNISFHRITGRKLSDYVIIDSQVKDVADRIVAIACENNQKVCFAKAMFYFVRDRFNYVPDPVEYEYIKTPQESLNLRVGDCDDASVLLAALLQAVGIRTRFVFVPGHVYIEAWLPEASWRYKSESSWVPMDATCKNCEFGEISWNYARSQKKFE